MTISASALRHDLQAGLTVGLVAIPQCMAFASIAGLPPASGLYAAIVMGVVGGLISGVPKVNIGPVATTSSMVYAVLLTTAPQDQGQWPAIAALLAVLVGLMTAGGALLRIGQFVRFVPRSVQIGLTLATAVLILGSQLAAVLGIEPHRHALLAVSLWDVLSRLGEARWPPMAMAGCTFALILAGQAWAPRFPTPFVALAAGGAVAWRLEVAGMDAGLESIGRMPRAWPLHVMPGYNGPHVSDLLVGAAAIAFSGIIQHLAIAKAVAARDRTALNGKCEMLALGAANFAAGFVQGLPGTASFARSALNDLSGAQSRLANVLAAASIAGIMLVAGPLTRYVTAPAIAGVLLAVACTIVDWEEMREALRHGRHERYVLGTMVAGVFVLPLHWAILIALALATGLFLQRVSRLNLFEMTSRGDRQFRERETDSHTGCSAITMLQVEGPLFFAHADEFAEALRRIFARGPRVTILRMRRTQQIDFSVIAALDDVVAEYLARGGYLLICGLAPRMRRLLRESPLGERLPAESLLQTTAEVFGSAHEAIRRAREILAAHPQAGRVEFRMDGPEPLADGGSNGA